MKTRELPEKISPGDELEVQLAPFGDFPNVVEEDGRRKKTMQRFGPEDAEKIVGAFYGVPRAGGGKSTLATFYKTKEPAAESGMVRY